MEHKTFELKIDNLNYEGRTMEGYAATFGNLDQVGDIIHRGAFAKTLTERGNQIKLLWQHNAAEPIGRIVDAREDSAGLFIKAIISDTSRGRDALALLRDGAINQMSIGYDAIKGGTDYETIDGESVRNLREIKLYEVSLVTHPANEMAVVTALKQAPSEGKPYAAFQENDQWVVYKVDGEGNPTGEALGTHDSEESAAEQIRALYAAEDDEDMDKSNDQPQETKAGRVLSKRNEKRVRDAVAVLTEVLGELGVIEEEDNMSKDAHDDQEHKAAPEMRRDDHAQPRTPPEDIERMLAEIELELFELENLEH